MTDTTTTDSPPDLCRRVIDAIHADRIDEAERTYERLCEVEPRAKELLIFPALIAIQRGQVMEALRFINTLPDDACPEIKAVCLNLIGDPSWHGLATSLLHSPDAHVRRSMRHLLGLPADA